MALRPAVLVGATLLFVAGAILLWRPLPMRLQAWPRILSTSVGAVLFFAGLGLYLWGMRSLGLMFGPSSGLGVRLQAAHRLITDGPYAHVRHPMCLAVIALAIGSLFLYRTWATLLFAVEAFGLAVRARREEDVLRQEFGAEWEAYASRVPA
jgi:protein-S-isoprenylcysteine O-methyltransferase Ste14